MDVKIILAIFALALFLTTAPLPLCGDSNAQQIEKRKCPTVEVKGASKSKALKNISYRAKVEGLSGATLPIFKWSVVGGVLLEGQGSDVITVEPQTREVRATVVIEKLPGECQPNSNTVVTKIVEPIPLLSKPDTLSLLGLLQQR